MYLRNISPIRISHQFGSWFPYIAGFGEILRFAQNDTLKQCVILRGGLCPEESLRNLEEEKIFLANVIAAFEKCGLIRLQGRSGRDGKNEKTAPTQAIGSMLAVSRHAKLGIQIKDK